MSDEKKPADSGPPAPKGSKLPLILLGVNFLTVTVALGTLVYTKVLFKRPPITERSERKRLEEEAARTAANAETGSIEFKSQTVNIAPTGNKTRYATIGFNLEIRDKTRAADIESVRPLILDRFLTIIGKKQLQELNQVQGRYVLRTQLVDAFNQVILDNVGHFQPPVRKESLILAAPPEHGGGEHGGGGHGGGEGHGAATASASTHEAGTEQRSLKDIISNVYFTQFMLQ